MPLDEYRAKRDFTHSPEPRGDTSARRTARQPFFCVQKHLASHLHYDLRLEHDGVLLSWAVPKGPAIDPSVKRLAMQVEDHPLEYGTFEGVIPDGYGAGIVMLWDQGTWEPEAPDVAAALRKGDLKLRLHGIKLKGSWALVRTRGAGERSWLLIKHRDEWSGPIDIATFAPDSVKSGGDFADILASENPSIWQSHRPAQSGTAGQMFARIIERALALRKDAEADEEQAAPPTLAPEEEDTDPATTTARSSRRKAASRRATPRASEGTRRTAPDRTAKNTSGTKAAEGATRTREAPARRARTAGSRAPAGKGRRRS